ncbi:hypothetical protein Tco_1138707, partial [Tanacetum coccineum]
FLLEMANVEDGKFNSFVGNADLDYPFEPERGEIVDRNGLNASYYHVNAPHSLDPLTTLKAKVIDIGKASALNQHERRPKSLFTL